RDLSWQGHREARSLAGGALEGDRSAQYERELADDSQTQTGSASSTMFRRLSLSKFFEHRALLLLRNADAGVGDLQRPAIAVAGARLDLDRAPLRELQRVAEKIAQDLGDLRGIGCDLVESRLDGRLQSKPLAARGSAVVGLDLGEQSGHGDFLPRDIHLSRFDLGDVEHVVDQAEQELGVSLHALEALPLCVGELSLAAA